MLSYVYSRMCALMCGLSHVCSHMCAPMRSHLNALICVLPHVCSHVWAFTCVLSYACSHMCALSSGRMLKAAQSNGDPSNVLGAKHPIKAIVHANTATILTGRCNLCPGAEQCRHDIAISFAHQRAATCAHRNFIQEQKISIINIEPKY